MGKGMGIGYSGGRETGQSHQNKMTCISTLKEGKVISAQCKLCKMKFL